MILREVYLNLETYCAQCLQQHVIRCVFPFIFNSPGAYICCHARSWRRVYALLQFVHYCQLRTDRVPCGPSILFSSRSPEFTRWQRSKVRAFGTCRVRPFLFERNVLHGVGNRATIAKR